MRTFTGRVRNSRMHANPGDLLLANTPLPPLPPLLPRWLGARLAPASMPSPSVIDHLDLSLSCLPVAGICAAGYTIEEAFEAIFSCEQARLAGFTTGFKAVGYSIKEAKVAGFAADELRIGGYSAEDVKIIGFSVVQAKAAGYTAKEAKAAGWTWEQLAEAGYALRPAERMKGMMNDILGKADLSDAGLARMFATIDADGSGKIDAEEMKRAVLKTYGQGVEAGVVEEMMRAADVDNSGEVDLEEFKVILRAGPDYIGPALV